MLLSVLTFLILAQILHVQALAVHLDLDITPLDFSLATNSAFLDEDPAYTYYTDEQSEEYMSDDYYASSSALVEADTSFIHENHISDQVAFPNVKDNFGVKRDWRCNVGKPGKPEWVKFKKQRVIDAVAAGFNAQFKGPVCGGGKNGKKGPCYPHQFHNGENIPFQACVKGARATYEYPILDGLKFKEGDAPGLYRVVYITKSDQKASFCGVMMHIAGNKFKECSWSST